MHEIAYLKGKMTEAQYFAGMRGQAAGAAIATGVSLTGTLGYSAITGGTLYSSTMVAAGTYGPETIALGAGLLGYDGEIAGANGDNLGRLLNKGISQAFSKSKAGAEILEFVTKSGSVGTSKLDNGVLDMNFNVPEGLLGQGVGKSMLEETFTTFGDKIKKVDVTWGMHDSYPNRMSKGLSDAWNNFDTFQDLNKAITDSGLFKLLKDKGFTEFKVYEFERDIIDIQFFKKQE